MWPTKRDTHLNQLAQQSLTDLIRGMRANKKSEDKYILQCLDEIRTEVRKSDPDVKAVAVQKLAYVSA